LRKHCDQIVKLFLKRKLVGWHLRANYPRDPTAAANSRPEKFALTQRLKKHKTSSKSA